MNNHQDKYKKKPEGFTSTTTGRLVRSVRQQEHRRINRAENFARNRDVPATHQAEEPASSLWDQETKFRRWQVERNIKKKMDARKKKPVFKVGIVHHKFYSPPVFNRTDVDPGPCHSRGGRKAKHNPSPQKRITRATQKRLEAKMAGTSTTPAAPVATVRKAKRTKIVGKKLPSLANEERASFAPENYSFKAPAGLVEIPLFGRFVIPRGAKTPDDKPSAKKKIEQILEEDRQKPWPRSGNLPVGAIMEQSRKPLNRQNAIDRLSLISEPSSRENSSIEPITLRLSSEEDSLEESNEAEEPAIAATELDSTRVKENIATDVADALDNPEDEEIAQTLDKPNADESATIERTIESDNKTPPRSGTPVPASFSPYIVSSRGKGSARKEQKMKMGIGSSPADEIPTKDTVMQNLNISVEEEEKTAQYFKFILQREIERLTEISEKWNAIMNEPDLTEDARYQINQAVGQTNLLIRKKFERFRSLVLDCETGKGEMLVQCRDLQGFWDMVYMEVKDCESRFNKLDYLRSNGWIEDQFVIANNKKVTKKKAVAAKAKVTAKSSARSWIVEARKKKLSQAEDLDTDDVVFAVKATKSEPVRRESRVNHGHRRSFGASPMTPTIGKTRNATPEKTPSTLRMKVQLSEASKSMRSPLAVMKISQMCKTPEVRLDDTITYVNSDQTPAKGILKKSDDSSGQESCPPKSTRKVDFNDEVFLEEVPTENEINEELQRSLDLGRALARIDSYDRDDDYREANRDSREHVTLRRAEKRLDFENDSFDETYNTDTAESVAVVANDPERSVIPFVNVIPSTPSINTLGNSEISSKSRARSPRRTKKVQDKSVDDSHSLETSVTTRILRSRTVAAETPSKKNRRSVGSSVVHKHDISLDSSTKENSDPSRKIINGINSLPSDIVTEVSAATESAKRRRSTRKTIKSSVDDCTVCTPKPAFVVTPRTRHSRKISLLGEQSRQSVVAATGGDLISFDSPDPVPARTRKSTVK